MASGVVNVPQIEALCTAQDIPLTATSYSCKWANYDLLIIWATQYSNVCATSVVPTSYFSTTTSTKRVLLNNEWYSRRYQIYQNGADYVYMLANQTEASEYRVTIYGVKL